MRLPNRISLRLLGCLMKRSNPLRPWAFAYLYDKLVEVAADYGYSLALHGSMSRDLDLIAVPWTENATSAEVLIAALNAAADRFRLHETMGKPHNLADPDSKPHGRIAWAIRMGGEPYIDISVMPRIVKPVTSDGN